MWHVFLFGVVLHGAFPSDSLMVPVEFQLFAREKARYGKSHTYNFLCSISDERVTWFMHRDNAIHWCFWPIGTNLIEKTCMFRSVQDWMLAKEQYLECKSPMHDDIIAWKASS